MKKLSCSLIVVFLFITAFSGCGKKDALKADQFANLPGQAQMLVSVNLEKLFAIPDIDSVIEKEMKDKEKQERMLQIYKKFKDRSYRFSFAIYPGKEKSDEIMIASLNLSYAKQEIIDILKEEGTEYSLADIKGLETIEILDKKEKSPDILVLLKNQILIIDKKNLDYYIQARKSGDKVLESPNLQEGLKRVSANKLFILVAGKMDQLTQQAQTLPGPKPQSAFAEIDYKGDAFVGKVNMLTKDETEAKNSVNMINGLKSLFAMSMSEKNPDAAAVLNKINISSEGKELKIDFQITVDEINKLSKLK